MPEASFIGAPALKPYLVVAEWDDEARVWVATSDDVPGLVAEAETREELTSKVRERVAELLELNRHLLRDSAHGGEIAIDWVEHQRIPLYA